MKKAVSQRFRTVNMILRMTVILALVLIPFGLVSQTASAAATINQSRDPSPPFYVLNNGISTELLWWKVTWDTSTPDHLTHEILDPTGAVIHTHNYSLIGAIPPVYNPEDPTGTHYGNPTFPAFAHGWLVPAGARPGTYQSRVIFYSSVGQEASTTVTFFVRQAWQIFKYNDLNGNAAYNNPPEFGLDGWDFTVTAPAGQNPFPGPSNTYSGTTSGGGFLVLPDVAVAGNYTITETLKPGWRNTDPGGVSPYSKVVTLPIPKVGALPYDPTVYFGNQELGFLEVFKFNDLNGNGTQDNGEPPLQGWHYTISGPGPYNSSGDTDSNGYLTRSNLVPGNYTVTETVQSGWMVTTLPNPKTKAVTSGQTTNYTFGNLEVLPGINIVKLTEGTDNNVPTGPSIPIGDPVTWTYIVTNTGNVPLSNIIVTDNIAGVSPVYVSGDANTDGKLDLLETWNYTASGIAIEGQYSNIGSVVGTPPIGSNVTDSDPDHYFGGGPPNPPVPELPAGLLFGLGLAGLGGVITIKKLRRAN